MNRPDASRGPRSGLSIRSRSTGASAALALGLAALSAAVAPAQAQGPTVRLPSGCLATATVVAADCSIRHVARCADFPDGLSSFQSDLTGRLLERVDRTDGLVAAQVWRPAPSRRRDGVVIDRATTRIGGYWVEIDLGDMFEVRLAEPTADLAPVQRTEIVFAKRSALSASSSDAIDGSPPPREGLLRAARLLRALRPGMRETLVVDLAPTEEGARLTNPPAPGRLVQRVVRAADANALLLDGGRPTRTPLRIYRIAVRSEPPGLALSETRYVEPRIGGVIGRRLDGSVDGEAVRRDGRPIAVFRVGDTGLLSPQADQLVPACVRREP